MTFTLSDRQHLEVMAKLSHKTSTNKKETITEEENISFSGKLLELTAKLRDKGLKSYASSLENKFILFKQAVSQEDLLYRAHTETGEDLIEFAHPDGDVEMGKASDGLGDVETQLSQHQKILDVIQKDPSKKKVSKAQSAQPIARPIDPQVSLADVANKFKVFAEYIRSHFLNEFTTDNTDPNSDQHHKIAILYFQLGYKIFEALLGGRSTENKPVSLVMNVIKGALVNTAAQNEKFTSLEDIDRFTNKILSWLEDNNPVKKAMLIGMVKSALKKEAIVPWAILVVWEHTRRMNVGIVKNSEILMEELNTALKEKEVINSERRKKVINDTIQILKGVKSQTEEFETNFKAEDKSYETASKFKKFLLLLSGSLDSSSRLMISLYAERTGHDPEHWNIPSLEQLGERVKNVVWTNTFYDVDKAIKGLKAAIEEQLAYNINPTIDNFKLSLEQNKKPEDVIKGPDSDPELNLLDKKRTELTRLQQFDAALKGAGGYRLNTQQKKQTEDWLAKQIINIKAADQTTIDKLVQENVDAEKQLKSWSVL